MPIHFVKALTSFPARALLAIVAAALLGGCAGTGGGGNYHTDAYAPLNPHDVQVKVSLATQNVYVLEGDHLLMATPTCVGKPGYPTPTGDFRVFAKNATKRSATYGYWVRGSEAHAGSNAQEPAGGGWSYVGYPMAYWVEFSPGFGFHEGPIWPYPRSHGCLHLHDTASAKFFEVVTVGTPVEIRQSLPEDATYGRYVKRPTDYADPDPPASLMISSQYFDEPRDKVLLSQTTTPGQTTTTTTVQAPAPMQTAPAAVQ